MLNSEYDVIVIGGGNAGLCAALRSAEEGSRVLLVERAEIIDRGGNTKYTRDIRYAHDKEDKYSTGKYPAEEFLKDIVNVTEGKTNLDLAKIVVEKSYEIIDFMEKSGVKLQKAYSGTLHLSKTNAFFLGGGKAVVNSYYKRAKELNVDILYSSSLEDIIISGDKFEKAIISVEGKRMSVRGRGIIIASGGFEANVEWLKKYWGNQAENFIIRGSRYNDGTGLRVLLEKGAEVVGNPKDMHSVAVDARSAKYDGGIVTRVDAIPFGIVVNIYGKRFYDEGEDIWPKRYAVWGKLIAEQPKQTAFAIYDSKSEGMFIPAAYPPYKANTIEELAKILGLDPEILGKTVSEYNSGIDCKRFNPTELDECKTLGITPPKSHWARPIDKPPFYAYPMRPGITFTYMGVKVDKNGRVMMKNGGTFKNIFAAGEIMMGNILSKGYLGGFGLTIGTVFGWISAESASSV